MEGKKYLIESYHLTKFCRACRDKKCSECKLKMFFDSYELSKMKNLTFGEALRLMKRDKNA